MRVLAVLAGVAMLAPAAASAQGNDPSANSPSGTIYEIPLDSARSDAAPREPDAQTAATGQPDNPSSSIHSADNGFGSSAVVPGAPASSASKPAGSGSGSSSGGQSAKRVEPRSSKSSPLTGGPAATTNSEALIHPAARAAEPSSIRAYVLLALAAGVALALGAGASFAARRR